jgi:hypothetical protein
MHANGSLFLSLPALVFISVHDGGGLFFPSPVAVAVAVAVAVFFLLLPLLPPPALLLCACLPAD